LHEEKKILILIQIDEIQFLGEIEKKEKNSGEINNFEKLLLQFERLMLEL
jgi:hypothetical protein